MNLLHLFKRQPRRFSLLVVYNGVSSRGMLTGNTVITANEVGEDDLQAIRDVVKEMIKKIDGTDAEKIVILNIIKLPITA
jgi:hypothetical protein